MGGDAELLKKIAVPRPLLGPAAAYTRRIIARALTMAARPLAVWTSSVAGCCCARASSNSMANGFGRAGPGREGRDE